jgi:hypothetical protein
LILTTIIRIIIVSVDSFFAYEKIS